MSLPVTQPRHSGMDARIQSQGCEVLSGIAPKSMRDGFDLLPSMALDTGIPAGMTARVEHLANQEKRQSRSLS